MRAGRGAIVVGVVALLAGCGGSGSDDDTAPGTPEAAAIEVVVAPGIPSIVDLSAVRCRRVDDTQLVAEGIVTSQGDDTHYVSLQVRFVDSDGVRVELATDTVSDLLVGEAARWSATTYADGAPDVRRCEVTATVS
jgi:hypothetical protein